MPYPRKRITTNCPACGTEFWYAPSWPRKYCSIACRGKDRVRPRRYTAICEQCQQAYETIPSGHRGRFCSSRCWGDWQAIHHRGAANPVTGRKFPRPGHVSRMVTLACVICQTPFTVKPSHTAGRRCCSRVCAAQDAIVSGRLAGPNSPTWRGGYEPYYGPSWRSAQRAVRLRDPICQRCCALPETAGRALDVHHLIPFRDFGAARHAEANALSNLVALCATCHTLFEWQTNRLAVHPASHP